MSFILQIAVPTPLRRYFDYLPATSSTVSPGRLQPGMRVKIPFQKRELVGIFMATSESSSVPQEKLKPILEWLDTESVIPDDILELCRFAADYYHYPMGEILFAALPAWLRQGKPAALKRSKPLMTSHPTSGPLPLNSAQAAALVAIQKNAQQFQVFLLNGITGSGKTEVYLQAIAERLNHAEQVLVLVPEIGLTPQTIQRFRERFSVPVIALHSAMTERQRFQAWLQAKSGEAKIVIGTRSAIFTPFAKLGLIIVDEEHDLSFKQQEGFRYHARDLAIMRGRLLSIPILLGSATPALETLNNAQQGRYQHLHLPTRAGAALLPEYHILDVRHVALEQGLSPRLLEEIQKTLAKGEQVMLFLNRRGFAPLLFCYACGWAAVCKRCDMRMTYHYKMGRLFCHHCEAQKNVAQQCENCGAPDLQAVGHGTERLESVLAKYFPHYSIARIDRDTTRRKGEIENLLSDIHQGKHQILIGTQMLAKGHHFPNVTLVAIVDADGGFFSVDFRALERLGQLLLQVSGRAGREEKPGQVFIQTRYPDHPLLHQLLNESYHAFSQSLLAERLQAELPPYAFFALFRAEAHQFEHAHHFLQTIKSHIESTPDIQIMGPLASTMPRRAGRYRVQLVLQAKQRASLQQLLKKLMPQVETMRIKNRVRWSLDVDPLEVF